MVKTGLFLLKSIVIKLKYWGYVHKFEMILKCAVEVFVGYFD